VTTGGAVFMAVSWALILGFNAACVWLLLRDNAASRSGAGRGNRH